MKMRKLIIIAPLGLILLVGSVVVWYLADDAWIKGKIEASVTEMTGRSLTIDGAFSLDWSSQAILIAEDVHFSNPSWAKNPDLAYLKKLEVSLDLYSLMSDPIKVNYIVADGLVVALEEHETGESSWGIATVEADDAAVTKAPAANLPISIGSLVLRDFTLLHEGPERIVPLDFHLDRLDVTQSSVQQLEFSTVGQFGGETIDLAGHLGPLNELINGGTTSHDIQLSLGDTILRSHGSIEQTSTLSGANIEFEFSGPKFEWILSQLALPEFSHGQFDFKLGLKTEDSRTHVDLNGGVGDLQATVQGSFSQDEESADIVADVAGGDLGGLLAVVGVEGVPRTPFKLKADASRAGGITQLQSFEFSTGGNSATLSGTLGAWPELTGTDLLLSVVGQDVSVWASVLQMNNLPARPFSLKGRLSPNTKGFLVDTVRLEFGDAFFEVDGRVGELSSFAGTQLSLDAAGPSLTDFRFVPGMQELPDLPFKLQGDFGVDKDMLTLKNVVLGVGNNSLILGGQAGLNEQLQGTEIQTQVRLPSLASIGSILGLDDLPDEKLTVSGNFQRLPGGWAFQMSDGRFADAMFASDGQFTATDGQYQIEATSQLSAPNLAQLTGFENLPELPVNISGFVQYDANEIVLRDMQGTLGDTQLKVSAVARNAPIWSGSEINVDVTGPDIGQFLVSQGIEQQLPFSLLGRIVLENNGYRLSQVKAGIGLLQASVDGVIGDFENIEATDLQLQIAAPSLQNIGELLQFRLPDEPFNLSTRFQGSPSVFRAETLEVNLGPSDLTGEFSVDMSGKADVNGTFNSEFLDLAWAEKAFEERTRASKPEQDDDKAFLIPDDTIELSQLDIANADVELRVASVNFQNRKSTDVHIHARVLDGNLYFDPLQTRGEDGGVLNAKLAVERNLDNMMTSVDLSFAGEGVQLGLGQYEGQDPSTFRKSDVAIDLRGVGDTYQALARSLDGRVEIIQGPGLTENTGMGLLFGNVISEVLNLINPFAKTEKFTVNECAVLVFNAESGVITADPIISQTEKMTMVAKGVADLNTENLQFTFNTQLRKGIGISASMLVNPFVSITGTLSSPVIGLDPGAIAVKGSLAVATMGVSLLVKSLSDRYLSSKDPCGDALKESRKQLELSAEMTE